MVVLYKICPEEFEVLYIYLPIFYAFVQNTNEETKNVLTRLSAGGMFLTRYKNFCSSQPQHSQKKKGSYKKVYPTLQSLAVC